MRMREIIRNWLGIVDVPVAKQKNPITVTELKLMIGDAIASASNGQPDYENWYVASDKSNALLRAVDKICEQKAKTLGNILIEDRINSEEFIDEIVSRIKRKQL